MLKGVSLCGKLYLASQQQAAGRVHIAERPLGGIVNSQGRAIYELLERHGFDTSTGESRHRAYAIMFISGLPLTHEGKAELAEFVLGERFLG